MKIISENNKYSVEMTNEEWKSIGDKNQWTKTAQLDLSSNNSYSNECNVSFYLSDQTPNKENLDAGRSKTWVNFTIEMDARSWGIKGFVFHITKIADVTMQLIEYVGDKDLTKDIDIQIDASRLQQTFSSGHALTTDDLDLWLNPDFTVDYEKSSIGIFNKIESI